MKYSPEEIEHYIDLFKQLTDEFTEADNKFKDDQDAKHWSDTYGERLGSYSDKLKLLNGDDFDVVSEARKEYHDGYSDLSEDEYVNALEENIKKVLARVWPEATEEQKEEVASEVAEETAGNEEAKADETEEATVEDPVQKDYDELIAIKEAMPKRER